MATAQLGLAKINQGSFAAGAFPGLETVPDNGAEDIVNAVIGDDGILFRRGGTTYFGSLSATDQRSFRNVWSGSLGAVGPVTVVSKSQGTTIVTELVSAILPGGSDFTGVFSTDTPQQRPVTSNGMLALAAPDVTAPIGGVRITAWGGATSADLLNQNVNLQLGNKTVIGIGTTFTALTPGMLLFRNATTGDRILVVESVQSDVQLTLLEPSPMDGSITVDFFKSVQVTVGDGVFAPSGLPVYMASIFDRVVYAQGSKVAFTPGQDPFGVGNIDDYHELPYGATVVGLEPVCDRLLVFSTQGVFSIDNMAYDLTDALGNVQQRLERVAPDVVLWDNLGVASWQGAVVAPCLDDVYLIDASATVRAIGGGIRRLYRSYVLAGYRPGLAQVFNSRFILPVFNGTVWVDTLVCDLRSGAWTRWDGSGVKVSAMSTVVAQGTRQPRLIGLGASGPTVRVHDLSATVDPASSVTSDADGTGFDVQLTTRMLTAPGVLAQMWRRFRARLETDESVLVDLKVASGRGSFANVSGEQVTVMGGEQVWSWPLHRRARAVRFKLVISGSTRQSLRAFEAFGLPSGRS